MAWFQKPGAHVSRMNPHRGNFFRHGDLIALLGAEPAFLPLSTGDVLVVRHDFKNQELGEHELGTILYKSPVYGPGLVAELQELEP